MVKKYSNVSYVMNLQKLIIQENLKLARLDETNQDQDDITRAMYFDLKSI
ncbi:hypothetical protein AGMMS50239_32370 [Bacteroidia bacterium]|nr:hypothetical protein AGMMS50239_32370 [Bacteroidia bacterium]